MPDQVIPRARIEDEARAAARRYADVNDACPYPFDSEAGKLFRSTFLAIRASLALAPELKP